MSSEIRIQQHLGAAATSCRQFGQFAGTYYGPTFANLDYGCPYAGFVRAHFTVLGRLGSMDGALGCLGRVLEVWPGQPM